MLAALLIWTIVFVIAALEWPAGPATLWFVMQLSVALATCAAITVGMALQHMRRTLANPVRSTHTIRKSRRTERHSCSSPPRRHDACPRFSVLTRLLLAALCVGTLTSTLSAQSSIVELNDTGWKLLQNGEADRAAKIFARGARDRPRRAGAAIRRGCGIAPPGTHERRDDTSQASHRDRTEPDTGVDPVGAASIHRWRRQSGNRHLREER